MSHTGSIRCVSIAARDRRELFALTLGLIVLLVAVKVILLPFPVSNTAEFVRWTLRLAIVSAPDICFAAGLLAVCLLLRRVIDFAPRSRAIVRPAWFVLFYVCGVYAIASIAIYRFTLQPLTLPVLLFAGGENMSSSVAACIGGGMWAALILAPVLLLLVPRVWGTRSASRLCFGQREDEDGDSRSESPTLKSTKRKSHSLALAAIVLLVSYGLVCRSYVHANWTDPNRWERRIAQSPHYVFLESCAKSLWRGEAWDAFDEVDESDFASPVGPARPPRWTDGIAPQQRPKNVVLILLESTSAEYLRLYGARFTNTPNLQRLAAAGGVVFNNAYVQSPGSCNSLAALTASIYPQVGWGLIVRDQHDLPVPTVAELLKEHGYRTCFAHSGYWSWKGRDEYLRKNGADRLIDADSLRGKEVNSWGVADRDMLQASLNWIDERPGQPFFLLAYTIETHHPYVARPPLVDYGVDDPDFNRYLNALAEADRAIAWLIDELDRRGLRESTLVVVTSDHGESFGQHNQKIHSFALYEPAVHVPLLLLHPALKDAPRRMAEVRQHVDIAPTIVDLLGFTPPPSWQGKHLFDKNAEHRAYFFACGNELVVGLRDGRWKYHYYVDTGYEELFDVANDPREAENLAGGEGRRCQEYQRRVGGYVQFQRTYLSAVDDD